ncbi:MAG TPA: hypothetical protein VK612_01815 [Pyrinomonadaceae bacterium]|nr:hypothetical protein [Pyrinomonadaceae bacterium]
MFTRINFLDNSRGLFQYGRFGNTYGNTPNSEGISFGETFYTDADGFRIDPEFRSNAAADAPAILIMGDSVAFGPALKDDKTIAGNLRRSMPDKRILNGAAIGYDTFDYKNAVTAIVEKHLEIKTVVLFFCLNDVSDASAQLIRSKKLQQSDAGAASTSIPRMVNDYLRSRSKLYLWLKNVLVDTQINYFRNDLAYYERGDENVSQALQPILDLDRLLKPKGIELKVFISPYEAQLRRESPPEFFEPQRKITTFLSENNVENYDVITAINTRLPDTKLFFLYGDPMHLSVDGAKVLANSACSKISGCEPQ